MSKSKDYIPRSNAAFLVWIKNLLAYVNVNFERMKAYVPDDTMTDMVNDLEFWITKCDEPNHGRMDIIAKNAARKKLEKEIRSFVQGVLARNPNVTDLDREAMVLRVYDIIPTLVSIPKVRTNVNVVYKGAGLLELHVSPEADISEDRRAYYGWKIQYDLFNADAPAPETRNVLNHGVFTRRKKELFVFQPEDSAKRMYFCARYENSKGQAGPWSNIMSAVIP